MDRFSNGNELFFNINYETQFFNVMLGKNLVSFLVVVYYKYMKTKVNPKYPHQNKVECQKIALKYYYRSEWRKNDKTSYDYACRHGWVEELTAHMQAPYQNRRKHTLESCKEKAQKYIFIYDFRTNEKEAYIATITNGWKKQVMGHLLTKTQAIKKGLIERIYKHTKEECHEKALLCKSRREMFKRFRSYYSVANEAGFMDEICNHMKSTSELISERHSKSSVEEIKSLVIANNYSRQELLEVRPDLIKYIYRHGVVGEIPFKATEFNKWTNSVTEYEINLLGKKSKNPHLHYKFNKLIESKSKEGKRRVKVEVVNLKTNQMAISDLHSLLNGQNPFFKLYKSSEVYIRDLIDNKLGIRSKNPQEHFNLDSMEKFPFVTIKNLHRDEIKEILFPYLKTKTSNPFSVDRFRSEELYKLQINKLGIKSKHPEEHYEYVSKRSVKSKGKPRVRVTIRNLKTRKIKDVLSNSLFSGRNPFTVKYDYHEVDVVQPIVKKFLLGLGLKILPEDMDNWKSRTRPDLILSNKEGRKIIIEVKSYKKIWMKKDLELQNEGYKKVGKKSFGNKYALTQTICLKGKYGMTLSEVKKLLKDKALI